MVSGLPDAAQLSRSLSPARRSGGDSRMPPWTPGSRPQRSVSSVPNDQPDSQMSGSPASTAYRTAASTSSRSVSPPPNSPSLLPCSDSVPRVLNRSTARSASAGSRYAALRYTWLSIIPPCVGSGCRQMSVAAGSRCSGSASSPIRCSPSSVVSVIGVRRAGRTVAALMSVSPRGDDLPYPPLSGWPGPKLPSGSVIWLSHLSAGAALQAPLPAHGVPVPPGRHAGVRRPHHHVRDARVQLLVAAGAAVRLGGRRAGHRAHDPVAVRPVLDPLGTKRRGRRGRPGFPGLAGAHGEQPYRWVN